MSRAAAITRVLLLLFVAVARDASAGLPERVYTLSELLDRASLIAVGKVEARDGDDAKRVRAGSIVIRTVLRGEPEVKRVAFEVDGPPLPVGALAIWVLAAPAPNGTYLVDHPQCAYDVTHLGILQRAVADPKRVRPGYYLRRDDERLAEEVRKAKELKMLRDLKAGPSADGLKVEIRLGSRSPRAGRGIVLDFVVTNTSARTVLVCDSAEECYYVRATRSRPARLEVGRAGAVALEVEKKLGLDSLVSEHDFVELKPGASTRRTLSVSAKVISALRDPGPVAISGIYRYSSPEISLIDLPADPWTGAVASADLVVTLRKPLESSRR